MSTSELMTQPEKLGAKETKLRRPSARYAGHLEVGAVKSKLGCFNLTMESLVIEGRTLDFEMSGFDKTGKFDVQGKANLDPVRNEFVCPSTDVCYVGNVAPPIPTKFIFSVRRVRTANEALCYVSCKWEEDEQNDWIVHGLLGVAVNQLAR